MLVLCGVGSAVELTNAEAAKTYDCMIGEMQAAYAKSGGPVSNSYQGWTRYSNVPCVSGMHGNRYVQNYGNAKAKAYGKFENAGRMPVGAILAKDRKMSRSRREPGKFAFPVEYVSAQIDSPAGR